MRIRNIWNRLHISKSERTIASIVADISRFEKKEFLVGNNDYRLNILQSILKDNNEFMKFHFKRMFGESNEKWPVIPDKDTTSLSVALDIGRLLQTKNIPYAIGGALALAIYSTPRNTQDVDMNVFLHISEMKPVLKLLGDNSAITDQYGTPIPIDSLLESDNGLIMFWWKNIKVEIFPNSLSKFSDEAMRTRISHIINKKNVSFLSAESLILFKILLGRNKDWIDIDRMLEVNSNEINKDYIDSWIDRIFEYNEYDNSMIVMKAKLKWNQFVSGHST